jgi:hypothetical protein
MVTNKHFCSFTKGIVKKTGFLCHPLTLKDIRILLVYYCCEKLLDWTNKQKNVCLRAY